MYLPLEKIESELKFSESDFILDAAVEVVIKADGRNWIPLIVREVGNKYKLVCNQFVYAVMQRASLDKVWAIVIDPDPKNIEQAKILSKESSPKINLSTASRSSIEAGLKFLLADDLKGINLIKATTCIDETDRAAWKDFTPITKLACGITKGKKLEALHKIFYIEPPVELVIPEPPKKVSVKNASRDEIFDRLYYLSTHKISGFDHTNPDQAADSIFTAQKSKWKTLNPITKLNCGIDTPQVKALKELFTL